LGEVLELLSTLERRDEVTLWVSGLVQDGEELVVVVGEVVAAQLG